MGPPAKRKASEAGERSEESEWEQEGGDDDDDDDQDDQDDQDRVSLVASVKDDSVSGGNESQEKKSPARRIRKPRRKYELEQSSGDDEGDLIPSQARLTEKGGYFHTSKSRLRISRANRGNTPWNKGHNRSIDVRAKISAGVRARNRAILLEKLKRLGMTEEEWFAKKKEIKYIRERLRRAKKANAHRQAEEAEKKLKEAIEMTTEHGENVEMKLEEMDTVESRVSSEDSGVNEKMAAKEMAKTVEEAEEIIEAEAIEKVKAIEAEAKVKKANVREVNANKKAKANAIKKVEANANKKTQAKETIEKVDEAEEAEELEVEEEAEEDFPPPSHFFKDFNWTPHTYDSKELSFAAGCPRGGPGGLICCESCTAQFSNFLSGTTRDIEQQKAAKMGGEMTELLGFLSSAKKLLGQSVRVARRKPVPMPRVNLKSIAALYDPNSQTPADLEEQNDDVENVAEVRRKPVPMPRVNDPNSQTLADMEEQNDDVENVAEV